MDTTQNKFNHVAEGIAAVALMLEALRNDQPCVGFAAVGILAQPDCHVYYEHDKLTDSYRVMRKLGNTTSVLTGADSQIAAAFIVYHIHQLQKALVMITELVNVLAKQRAVTKESTTPPTSVCRDCGKPIQHNGKHWVHTTYEPRHIAQPPHFADHQRQRPIYPVVVREQRTIVGGNGHEVWTIDPGAQFIGGEVVLRAGSNGNGLWRVVQVFRKGMQADLIEVEPVERVEPTTEPPITLTTSVYEKRIVKQAELVHQGDRRYMRVDFEDGSTAYYTHADKPEVENHAPNERVGKLTIAELQAANAQRNTEWDSKGVITLEFRGNELAGEVGEACNKIKKLARERLGLKGSRTTTGELGLELGDVVICASLIAMQANIDLEAAVCEAFNNKSRELGLTTYINNGRCVIARER